MEEKEGRKEGRKEGKREGRREGGRKGGRKEGKKEGSKEGGNILDILKKYLLIFRERRGREKERERNINVWLPVMRPLLGTWPATQACVLTGNQTSDPLVHRLALNPLSHTSQGRNILDTKRMGRIPPVAVIITIITINISAQTLRKGSSF